MSKQRLVLAGVAGAVALSACGAGGPPSKQSAAFVQDCNEIVAGYYGGPIDQYNYPADCTCIQRRFLADTTSLDDYRALVKETGMKFCGTAISSRCLARIRKATTRTRPAMPR